MTHLLNTFKSGLDSQPNLDVAITQSAPNFLNSGVVERDKEITMSPDLCQVQPEENSGNAGEWSALGFTSRG